ncbi:hypothetical protein B9J07_28305 [Sinorhizobium sp. LM21]|uniref:hypothetical protein n=1 Tax=Sinorhizobium sp. LM21 TaxID=1449788 RepID=UPI0005D7B673|nr:hypothetical protein [Sinorhizobium sp. LM21]AJW30256.1 hypothetical protein pLM21S1_p138 [Sinorhizobium sp. LM21]OWZ90491.1 hypothetical protein B9J07_28305 [Sinorhizobium sp. LM21]
MKLSVNKDLTPLREAAISRIDAFAEQTRNRYLSPGAGQSMVYDQKRREAETFMAAYNANEPIPESDLPHLIAEAARNGIPLLNQAIVYLTMRQLWLTVSPMIEDRRLMAKAAVMAAQSPAEIDQAVIIDWSDLPTP